MVKLLGDNKSAPENSRRLMAPKLKVGVSAANRIPKNMGKEPLKHLKTTTNAVAKKQKREKVAQQIAGTYDSGVRAREIFFPDETWAGQESCARFNPQNERINFDKAAKKDDVVEKLYKPEE